MVSVLSFLALSFLIDDVTLPNGVREISSPAQGAPAVAVSPDQRIVVLVGDADRAAYAAWPSPSPAPLGPAPSREQWRIENGAPLLVVEWAAPSVEDALLLAVVASNTFAGASVERRDGILRLSVDGGWPPESRRRVDAELERLASLSNKELPAVKEACASWATPRNNAERARRLLSVTLATGNPRLYRELSDRCARLTIGNLASAARKLLRQPRRILVKTPVEPRAGDP